MQHISSMMALTLLIISSTHFYAKDGITIVHGAQYTPFAWEENGTVWKSNDRP